MAGTPKQIPQAEKEKILAEYNAGASISELVARSCVTSLPRHQGTITRILVEAGAKIRSRAEAARDAAKQRKAKTIAYYRGY